MAIPLGGIGAGTIALAGDGGLRQWQIVHNVNHLAHVPHSFFALWAESGDSTSVARVLQSSALYDQTDFTPSVTANDHVVPEESKKLLAQLPAVKALEYTGEYPIAQIRYTDPAFLAEVSLEAHSPFIPLNSKDSGLPAIIFEFQVRNPGNAPLHAALLATLQNLIGWDGQTPIAGVESLGYGGNQNTLSRQAGLTAIEMSNPHLPADFPFQGTLALAVRSEKASHLAAWDDLDLLWKDFSQDGQLTTVEAKESSALGRTWNGALAVPMSLEPGEAKNVVFLTAWFFPNRYVNWNQSALTIGDRKSKFWLGTMYSNWFASAREVLSYVHENFTRLRSETRLWRDTFYDSTLPCELLDAVSSQASIIRTPTCIWVQDGHLHGFEGCCGASTGHCRTSGCCPLNCTHVWNYEQSLSRLFPSLERTMRHTDLEIQQAPAGYIPHRTAVPFSLPRPWDRKIGGPDKPALDGMLGEVLKTHREYRQGAGRDWLASLWPHIEKLMNYIIDNLDSDHEGVIDGEQPNTYDISIYGPNSFIGSLYLVALRAAEQMARVLDNDDAARRYREIFDRGRKNLPALIWNDEYYVQKVDLQKYPKHQYGAGCHSDQLLGQWWAHQLDLGYVLPEAQVRSALQSILKYNWRQDFVGVKQAPRVFASEHDQGLLNCTWPHGERPETPTLYSDEVWTGIEYEVAGLLLYEGMVDNALKLVRGARARYDGRERNPWNDIECGDHYVRAMSSWTLLEAAAGQRYNAAERFLAFAPKISSENFRCPFITAAGWGTFDQRTSGALQVNTLSIAYGRMDLQTLELALQTKPRRLKVSATLNGKPLAADSTISDASVRLTFAPALNLGSGDSVRVKAA